MGAMSLCLLASATFAAATLFSPVELHELNTNGSIFSCPSAYYITMDNIELDASSTINIRLPNISQLAMLYEQQYAERDVEFGMSVNLAFLKSIRNIESYEREFINFIQKLSFKGKLFFAYELSQLPYDSIFGCEEEYIVQLLKSDDVEKQEVALNAVANWDNHDLIRRLSDLRLKNVFLQQELDELKKELD